MLECCKWEKGMLEVYLVWAYWIAFHTDFADPQIIPFQISRLVLTVFVVLSLTLRLIK